MSSLPIIDKFLWLVVVSTVSPVTQYAEDEFKIDKKHRNLARIPEFSRELLLAGYIK